ncbi:unnamed protein product [Ceutorhynchus assimilis]|uniref:E3 ubiquitin-protein ligase RNF10 n=1 Tax=Ceutorhynchus assimilis TaxID=467358 RepID=A0A9N9MDB1_9CUCU|nr:unnamed protein product [Ceutorhynchus assimilis]
MEKKKNRNMPNSSRSSFGNESKKVQDAATNKLGSRVTPRRREPSCGFTKPNETNRKSQPPRNTKTFDKRPKPRGYYYAGAVPRNEEAGLEEFDEPELGSVFLPGSKKQSLNHLLNFSFAPRENAHQGSYYHPERVDGNKKGEKLLATRKHKYNKEHFLQANCQFIVNETGDYKQYLNNPDALVNWDLVEQVNVQVNEEPSCPICLYPPVAAKMTKCGHVYCWPCILHYLALSDKPWRKCPICYDAIKKNDLKSVVAIPHKTFSQNDRITFKLMKRLRGSLTAYPADAVVPLEDSIFKISDQNNQTRFSKLFLADKNDIEEIIGRETRELDILMAEDDNCPEICFIEEAKQFLESRKNQILANESINIDQIDTNLDVFINQNLAEADAGPQMPKFFYFYQAEDGQHIYLHAINAKMLEHTYGSLEFCPKTLDGRILEKEGGSMTEELRKKLRYLQHLPVTCQFEVAEIKLSEPQVNQETLDYFRDQIELRRKRRQRRAKEEKKREKRIEAEENKIIGIFDSPELQLDSRDQFPDVKQSHDMFPDYLDHRLRSESESTFMTHSERSISPDLASSISGMSLENTHSGPSFATMLASENKPSWPTLKAKPTNQPSSAPVKLITVTGPKMSSVNVAHCPSDGDVEQDGDFGPVPDFNRSFGDALAEALAKELDVVGEAENDVSTASGRKKKKKNKQKLLFSTRMAYPGN